MIATDSVTRRPNRLPSKGWPCSHSASAERKTRTKYLSIFASNTSLLECTLKIYVRRGGRRETHPTALGYLDFDAGERLLRGRDGGGKGLRVEWKNSFDIISNFFETRSRYAGLARSLTHVRRRVTVKHLAPAGAGYVT